jgi:hypothetical protein
MRRSRSDICVEPSEVNRTRAAREGGGVGFREGALGRRIFADQGQERLHLPQQCRGRAQLMLG